MAFICEETSLSKFWMLEGALLFNWTVLHPPTQVGHVVSLDLGQQFWQTSLPQEVTRRGTPLSSRAKVLQVMQCAHILTD